ncbi:Acetyl-CoA acetyltransferase [Phycisphaerae bacterium RAS1]|nr:Acetyl-CoA acetyltransferase [Phycisphaerae bacterium RAS1]
MPARNAYIAAVRRSPIGNFMGSLSKLSATALCGQVAKALLDECKVDRAAINEVFIGQVLQAGCGQNPARQVALAAGIPDTISCVTINKVCGSGIQAAMFADQLIRAGDVDVVLTGGMESMSNAPHLLRGLRAGHKFGKADLVDEMEFDGLTNIFDGEIMGAIADETGARAGITRQAQDEFALRSHQRAAQGDRDGLFDGFRVPVAVPKAERPFNTDETIRAELNPEKIASLKAVFRKDGTVTAANASTISDGAAAVLVTSEAGLKKCGVAPLARIVAHATSGGPPRDLFFTPIGACRMVCEKAGWDLKKVDLWEINEAFAAQMLTCMKGLELGAENMNIAGGAIALGHPIGASGSRILGTLAHLLKRKGLKRGVASACLGGGNAVAIAIEAV